MTTEIYQFHMIPRDPDSKAFKMKTSELKMVLRKQRSLKHQGKNRQRNNRWDAAGLFLDGWDG